MALAVNGVRANPYVNTAYVDQGNGKTTITPFSDILKKEKEQAAAASAQTASSSGATSASARSGVSVRRDRVNKRNDRQIVFGWQADDKAG